MKLTYWVCRCIDDSDAYSIRDKTKKAAVARREEYGAEGFEPVKKVTVEYLDAFDLMNECTTEGRLWWEFKTH